jgi:hypothetical protein
VLNASSHVTTQPVPRPHTHSSRTAVCSIPCSDESVSTRLGAGATWSGAAAPKAAHARRGRVKTASPGVDASRGRSPEQLLHRQLEECR